MILCLPEATSGSAGAGGAGSPRPCAGAAGLRPAPLLRGQPCGGTICRAELARRRVRASLRRPRPRRLRPNVIASIAAALRDHGLASAKLGFDVCAPAIGSSSVFRSRLRGGRRARHDDALPDRQDRARARDVPPGGEGGRPVHRSRVRRAAAGGHLGRGPVRRGGRHGALDAIPVDEGAMLFGGASPASSSASSSARGPTDPGRGPDRDPRNSGEIRGLIDGHQPHCHHRRAVGRVPGAARRAARRIPEDRRAHETGQLNGGCQNRPRSPRGAGVPHTQKLPSCAAASAICRWSPVRFRRRA